MAGSAWTNQVQNLVIIAGPAGTIAGLFIYSGIPGPGNPPISWDSSSSKDPYGNTIQPGVMLAELAANGNAQGGLIWNNVVPGAAEPLLALFPNATVGFTGHSPFITAQVFNRGAANERLALSLGGGAGSGSSSPVMLNLFSVSKDGTLHGHATLYGGASGNQLADFSETGLTVVNQIDGNTYRAGHLTLPANATPQTISSTTMTTITGCSAPVAAGTYEFRAVVQYAGNQAAGTANFQIGGPSNSAAWISALFASGATFGSGMQTASPGTVNSPTLTTANWTAVIEGMITFTASGTMSLQAAEGTATDSFVIKNAKFVLSPL